MIGMASGEKNGNDSSHGIMYNVDNIGNVDYQKSCIISTND